VYDRIATKCGCPGSSFIPTILSLATDLVEARAILEMPVSSIEELAAKLSMDKDATSRVIHRLYEKGLVLPRKKGGFRAFYSVTELKDTLPANPKFDAEYGSRFFDLWDEFFDSAEIRRYRDLLLATENRTKPLMRLIPKWKAIKDVPGAMWFDDIRHLLLSCEDSLALNYCSCRRISRKHADAAIPEELCLVEGKTAEYCLSRGSARKVTLGEALAFLDRTESLPLVHVMYNGKPMTRLIGSCGSYCIVFRWSGPRNILECNPTRFKASINPKLCLNGCHSCVDACDALFGAIVMREDPSLKKKSALIMPDKCWGCGNCVVQCPSGAISMECIRSPDSVPDEYVGPY